MDYNTGLQQLETLRKTHQSSELPDLQAARVDYQTQLLDDPQQVLRMLQAQAISCGWITWPDQVQRLSSDDNTPVSSPFPPLEAELLLKSGNSLRLNFRAGCWYWVEISLNAGAADANVLTDTQIYAAREANQPGLLYQRLWEFSDATGMTITDAIFSGYEETRS